ncbi:YgaP family membrane protein [Algoriphagus mannitolivorans]|uniref:YgaP family membrane protein n=1 Tax=Algoriphagus mannitolivorans TaxID=226504 RepID=UPI00047E8962|nr:DUF2892 domain-containing protein [Algoriphagus mannitolivorans]
MKKNMGIADRVIRLLVAIILVALYFSGTISGVLGVVGLALAVIFTLTSIVSFCPLYTLIGASTCPNPKGIKDN